MLIRCRLIRLFVRCWNRKTRGNEIDSMTGLVEWSGIKARID